MRLSQDALFILSRKYKKRWGVSARRFILFFAALLLIGCSVETPTDTVKASNPGIWQCLSAPHIRILFDSYDEQDFVYFRLVCNDDTTYCRTTEICSLLDITTDGCWKQITTATFLLLPPPPGWDNQPRKKGTGIRINGSVSIPMQTLTPLPNDKQITIEKEKPE